MDLADLVLKFMDQGATGSKALAAAEATLRQEAEDNDVEFDEDGELAYAQACQDRAERETEACPEWAR
jgi:hypothetical protein